ncbi:23S rRNA (guanine(745)-N(1))-methyltransferase [Moellerella wisconsensis]|uniref:Ribosomal RNA large subunit methyltransferase A n=1 Tax=Moellerella wisconsensis ATCC 35017 TaxID=1354267 RepID=A0A0N1KI17_9GAMM|nr:23S rRNA (guanine(745)-N(1))-methyltransferase [Moellerella wisconsensis]KPD02668.1 ribosomal RNA large subunit methyltransferase A [Moellerella wisconsensis ATCC 35017]VFS53261.1 Ribosomal RNA large subunit methyltransferase A [Moellerella wisconsensis]
MNYQCPLCHHPLLLTGKSWICQQNHHFDCAKEGYVNLLPVQHKRSKQPGDSAEMMQARREFLDAGYYQPMRDLVAEKLGHFLPELSQSILDIGCGEGYYTAQFVEKAASLGREIDVIGLDVSKAAIRSAAKRYTQVNFCVASSHRLPFNDSSMGAVIRIYAPCKAEELQRVIENNGILITVTPAPEHLKQLKALIYSEVRLHPVNHEDLANFELIDQQQLTYTLDLSGSKAFDLLQMTPFAWRASEAVKQQLKSTLNFHCTADFMVNVYRLTK